jgi:hypothetical protein
VTGKVNIFNGVDEVVRLSHVIGKIISPILIEVLNRKIGGPTRVQRPTLNVFVAVAIYSRFSLSFPVQPIRLSAI